MGALGFLEKFLCILGIILAFCNAYFASSVTRLAAVEAESAGVVFFRCGGDVRAGHDTVILTFTLIYDPAGELCGSFFSASP